MGFKHLPICRITHIRISRRLLLQCGPTTLTGTFFSPLHQRTNSITLFIMGVADRRRSDGVSLHFDDIPPSFGPVYHLRCCLPQIEEVIFGKLGGQLSDVREKRSLDAACHPTPEDKRRYSNVTQSPF